MAPAAAVNPGTVARSADDSIGSRILEVINEPVVWLGLKIVVGLVLVWIGIRVGGWLSNLSRRLLLRAHVDPLLAEFLRNVTYVSFLALLIVSALELSGFPTTSLLTTLGAAGLAIGLALKDSLSHIAAGVVLIVLRPFRVGDAVNIAGQDGVVEGIFIFTTRLHTFDNRDLIFMNGQVIAAPIFNYSERPNRRIDITLQLTHGADLRQVFAVAKQAVGEDKRILAEPAPYIGVGDITEKGIAFLVQAWSATSDMGAVKSDLLLRLQAELADHAIEFVRNYPPTNFIPAKA
jgi:small-conductance mechanosensitive channel